MTEERTNSDRAATAFKAVATYVDLTRFGDRFDDLATDELGDYAIEWIGDLVCDLLHLARLNGLEPEAIFEQARFHFDAEEDEEVEAI